MNGILTKDAGKQYLKLPKRIQSLFDKQLDFLLEDFRYPSLNSKKYDEGLGLWQARINDFYRFYLIVRGDVYVIVEIRKHPK